MCPGTHRSSSNAQAAARAARFYNTGAGAAARLVYGLDDGHGHAAPARRVPHGKIAFTNRPEARDAYMQKLFLQSQRPGEPLTASQSEALRRHTAPSRTPTNAGRAEERHGGVATPPATTTAGSRDLGRNDNDDDTGEAADVRAENGVTASTHAPITTPARKAILGAATHEYAARTTVVAARAATVALRPAVSDYDRRAAQETRSPDEQADIMAESESEHAESEKKVEVEERPGARDKARRWAAAVVHEAALCAAALAEMATKAAAPAVAPGGNAQQRGTKRSAPTADHDAETTGNETAAQRDAPARSGATAAEEAYGPGAPSPGQVGLVKPANWGSMSKSAKTQWKQKRAKHKGNT